MENGKWGEVKGLNPHSYGEGFSRSLEIFIETIILIIIKIIVNKKGIIDIIANIKITYIIKIINNFFNWKLNVMYILYK